jgi:GDP-4-dehydro-6-deoxy-D-mannose reductase
MRALVTGAEGFVGPYLISFLKKEGIDAFGTYFRSESKKKNFYRMDVTDKEEVFNLMKKIKPDYLFHLAGFSSVKASFDNPELCMKINVEGTRNILDAIFQNSLKTKILVVSSAEVYGKPKFLPITEEHPLSASSPYGESRIKQEELCAEYAKNGLFIVISRSFNHTGPEQTDTFVIPSFAKQIALIEKSKQKVINVGNLGAVRDFSDVRDVVRAYYMLLKKGNKGEKYNVCSGKGYVLKDILKKLTYISGADILIEKDTERMRAADIPALVGDNTRIRETTGWKPEIDIDETLRDVLEYWRKEIVR